MLEQEGQHRRVERLWLLEIREVAGTAHHREPRARDATRHRLGQRDGVETVLVARHHQRRHRDRLDPRAAILARGRLDGLQVRVPAQCRHRREQSFVRASARRRADQVLRELRRKLKRRATRLQRAAAAADESLDLLGRERVEARCGVGEHECRDARRMA
ncbi:MAG TPA: hypothetical protein VLC47_07240 [Burkholderiales bacterium]|nr:hypothetical protein [Burkholderiales bacterium]